MQKRFDKELARLIGEATRHGKNAAAKPRILVAVSGGVDSIALANLFAGSSLDVDFAIAHCNFSLRGAASDADEQFVTYWALNRGITLYKTTFDTFTYAADHHLSTEMAARELRYEFFARTCADEGYDFVALGHNANDNAETLLLNLVRGTGIAGAGGIRPVATSEQGIKLLRPILWATRTQIEAYAAKQGLLHCEDATNAEPIYKRNIVRLNVIPELEKLNPSVVKTLAAEAEVFAAADDFARYMADNMYDIYLDREWVGAKCIETFRVYDVVEKPGWEYVIHHILSTHYGFNSAAVTSFITLLKGAREDILTYGKAVKGFAGKTFTSATHEITTSGEKIFISPLNEPADEMYLRPDSLEVPAPGEYQFGDFFFKVSLVLAAEIDMARIKQGEIYAFDADKLGFPLKVRGYRAGDKMKPFGISGSKKLSDIFTDLHWSMLQKDRAVVIEAPAPEAPAAGQAAQAKRPAPEIALLAGYRIARPYKLTKASTQAIIIEQI